MSLISVDEVQAQVGTPLDIAYLAPLITDIESELTAAVGSPDTAITESHAGYTSSLYLKRPIATITSITEYETLTSTTGKVLTTSDYFVWNNEGRIQRLHQKWKARATVIYVPVDDSSKRRQVVIGLVKFYLAHSPLKQEGISGEYTFTAPPNWEEEKARLIQRLRFAAL